MTTNSNDRPAPPDIDAKLATLLAEIDQRLRVRPFTAWEYILYDGCGWSLEYLNGQIEKLERYQTHSLEFVVYHQQQRGCCSTNLLDTTAIEETIEQAYQAARYAEADPAAQLTDPALLAWNPPSLLQLELCYEPITTAEQVIAQARQLEPHYLTVDPRITKSGGITFESGCSYRYYANSNHFAGGYQSSCYLASGSLLAQDQQGNMQRDGYWDIKRNPNKLLSLEAIMDQSVQRVLSRLDARPITPRRCPVIYPAELAADMLTNLVAAASGRNLYLGNSFLINRLDSPIFPAFVQLTEYPFTPEGIASAPFDNEGAALQATSPLVVDGRLVRYLLDSYAAHKLQLATTGNAGGVRNLTMAPSQPGGLAALLAKMDTGLLITELYSGNQNILNGDYSCGAFGYLVEHGQIQYPVKELTVAGNLKELFAHLVATGDDLDRRHAIISGSLLFEEMTVASSCRSDK